MGRDASGQSFRENNGRLFTVVEKLRNSRLFVTTWLLISPSCCWKAGGQNLYSKAATVESVHRRRGAALNFPGDEIGVPSAVEELLFSACNDCNDVQYKNISFDKLAKHFRWVSISSGRVNAYVLRILRKTHTFFANIQNDNLATYIFIFSRLYIPIR